MLARNFRFSINNQAGVSVTVAIKARFWKWASDGSLTYDSGETTVFNVSGIASSATAWTNDTAIDNSTNKWLGAHITATVTPASSVTNSGTTNVFLQLQHSTDAGTTWPGAGNGQNLANWNIPTGSSASVWNAEIEV